MEENWPKPAYRVDGDPLYCANQKEYDRAVKDIKDGGLGLSTVYIHREFPRRVYDPNGGTKLVLDETGLELAIKEGWSKEAIAPKPAEVVIKGTTQAEYENQVRISALEAKLAAQSEMMGEMMQIIREKASVELERPKRGRPPKVAIEG
jgi:hypothetical protein